MDSEGWGHVSDAPMLLRWLKLTPRATLIGGLTFLSANPSLVRRNRRILYSFPDIGRAHDECHTPLNLYLPV